MLKRTISGAMLTLVVACAVSLAFDEPPVRLLSPYEFVVDQKGGGTFLSIQEGIDSGIVNPGDVLKVWWGPGYVPYTENVNVTIPNLTIKSDVMHNGVLKPVIDGGGKGAVFNVTANNAAIINFMIQNGKCGINLFPTATNNTVAANLIKNNAEYGIYVNSENNTLRGNTLTANYYFGISVLSSGNFLRDNNMTNNTYNFGISNFVRNDIDTSNTVNGKLIYIWIDQHYREVPPNAGYIAVINSTNIIAKDKDLKLSNNDYGVRFINTSNSTIANVEASHNLNDGVYLLNTANITIENVNASNDAYGISLESSSNSRITGNIASNNRDSGIYLHALNNSQIIGNIVSNSYAGISLTSSKDNTFIENTIQNNRFGILDLYGLHNRFYHNNIKNNIYPAVLPDSYEYWDNGEEGNYWSDYIDVDTNNDGIWDHPYKVANFNYDDCPLVDPWKSVRLFNVAKSPRYNVEGYNITVHSNHVIASLNFTRMPGEVYPRLLSFNLTAGSSGFCNITISRAWLDGPFNLWIGDINKDFDQITQNATHSSLYFTYAAGKYQVEIVGIEAGTVLGDLNRDGKIDLKDVYQLHKMYGWVLPPNLTPEDITEYDP